eukprot:gnl/MRDRNA2_/MRDRNA2_27576_c0_seq1.p1 gnl/MRDRNA2_/MRDRNA2_27576_c0~~gnl/MRDRNA2_/MRDRNA2_27576_c0_seq1.p1  ORF type:complete len:295 (-),score=29.28 gnl/MRDRNA2_/MRDRNA2_27576_c0_seq1:170-1054(-)
MKSLTAIIAHALAARAHGREIAGIDPQLSGDNFVDGLTDQIVKVFNRAAQASPLHLSHYLDNTTFLKPGHLAWPQHTGARHFSPTAFSPHPQPSSIVPVSPAQFNSIGPASSWTPQFRRVASQGRQVKVAAPTARPYMGPTLPPWERLHPANTIPPPEIKSPPDQKKSWFGWGKSASTATLADYQLPAYDGSDDFFDRIGKYDPRWINVREYDKSLKSVFRQRQRDLKAQSAQMKFNQVRGNVSGPFKRWWSGLDQKPRTFLKIFASVCLFIFLWGLVKEVLFQPLLEFFYRPQ